jgi:hypothetical protein
MHGTRFHIQHQAEAAEVVPAIGRGRLRLRCRLLDELDRGGHGLHMAANVCASNLGPFVSGVSTNIMICLVAMIR